jgi:hypothetical protein
MFRRILNAFNHKDTDKKIEERDRIAMAALIKDQKNRVRFVEAREGTAKSPTERMKYRVKLREERRQLAQLENPDEQQLFAALGIEL